MSIAYPRGVISELAVVLSAPFDHYPLRVGTSAMDITVRTRGLLGNLLILQNVSAVG